MSRESTSARTESPQLVGSSPQEKLLAPYAVMALIRQVEQALSRRSDDGDGPDFVSLSVGQQALAARAASAPQGPETLATAHRGHGHIIVGDITVERLF